MATTTYQFNNNNVRYSSSSSSSDSSSSSSDSSSSSSDSSISSSLGTFEDGFKADAADAKAGRSAIYGGDPINYEDPYKAGYADGYQNPYLV